MLGILFAAMHAPTPVPHTIMPRSALPLRTASQTKRAISGKSIGSRLCAKVLDLMPLRAQEFNDRTLERKTSVIAADGQLHDALLISSLGVGRQSNNLSNRDVDGLDTWKAILGRRSIRARAEAGRFAALRSAS